MNQVDDAEESQPGLQWPIKRSFILYVARMTDGQILGGRGLRMHGSSTFVFTPAPDVEPEHLSFTGELRLSAHAGALSLRIANPMIDLRGERASMRIDHPDAPGAKLTFVTLNAHLDSVDASLLTWRGTDVRLTADAVPLFGGYYGEGEPFDDLTATVAQAAT